MSRDELRCCASCGTLMSKRGKEARHVWAARKYCSIICRTAGLKGREAAPVAERIWTKVTPEPNTGCWLFLGGARGVGYGGAWSAGSMRQAHRLMYEALRGPIPLGMHLDHLCRTRCCVNPAHLEPVTPQVNTARGHPWHRLANRTHCKRGHPFSGDNLTMRQSGARACKACQALRSKWQRAGSGSQ